MPTLCPARDRDRASCVVMEDLPTPPLPERTLTKKSQFLSLRTRGGKYQDDIIDVGK